MKESLKIAEKIDSNSLQGNKSNIATTGEKSSEVIRKDGVNVKKQSQIACLEHDEGVLKLNRESLLSVIGNKLNLSMLSAFK